MALCTFVVKLCKHTESRSGYSPRRIRSEDVTISLSAIDSLSWDIEEIHLNLITSMEFSHKIHDDRINPELLAKLEDDFVIRLA
jgi:hypothetical protein